MSLHTLPKRLVSSSFRSSQSHQSLRTRRQFCIKMSAESAQPLTHSLTLPSQLNQPVQIVAAPGVSDSEFRNAIESSLFRQWLKNLQSENGVLAAGVFLLKRVLIQGVDMFGRRIGFLKFKADIFHKETGEKIPGIVFARGPAVAVLILLDSDGETYAVLTEQDGCFSLAIYPVPDKRSHILKARVPAGRFVLELPAGMLDDDKGDFLGTAVREVEEETGIHLKVEDMVDLTSFLDKSTGHTVFPSPGGCDEELSVFLYRGCVSKEIITQLQGKETGLRGHGELIKVCVVPYLQLWRMTADAKVLMAIALYEMAKKEGLLPLKT